MKGIYREEGTKDNKRILLRKYLLSIIIPLLILGFVLTYFIMQLTREKVHLR